MTAYSSEMMNLNHSLNQSLSPELGDTTGCWVPILEYAAAEGVSLSTLRRHIKSNKIPHRMENGRYLVWSPESNETTALRNRVAELEKRIIQASETISELKMLVSLYEEQQQIR